MVLLAGTFPPRSGMVRLGSVACGVEFEDRSFRPISIRVPVVLAAAFNPDRPRRSDVLLVAVLFWNKVFSTISFMIHIH